MPIIEPISDPKSPLSQGDILKGVTLFSTKRSWEEGGEHHSTNHQLCLVVSRPCNAVRDSWVIVTGIDRYKNRPKHFSSFAEAKAFYTTTRDGLTTPDQFYLGQISGQEGSFCAKFESFHTIQIPKYETPERQTFLETMRIGRLNKEFIHDLHSRMFRAFASLGFDDHTWFSTDDLRVLVLASDSELAAKNMELLQVQQKLQFGRSRSFNQGEKERLEKQEKQLQEAIRKMEEESKPYRDELQGRD